MVRLAENKRNPSPSLVLISLAQSHSTPQLLGAFSAQFQKINLNVARDATSDNYVPKQ